MSLIVHLYRDSKYFECFQPLPAQGFSNYDLSPFQPVLEQNLKKLGIDWDYISLQLKVHILLDFEFCSASLLLKIEQNLHQSKVSPLAVTALVRKGRCLKFRISMFIRKLRDVHTFSRCFM